MKNIFTPNFPKPLGNIFPIVTKKFFLLKAIISEENLDNFFSEL